jgi:hypothetical protein
VAFYDGKNALQNMIYIFINFLFQDSEMPQTLDDAIQRVLNTSFTGDGESFVLLGEYRII